MVPWLRHAFMENLGIHMQSFRGDHRPGQAGMHPATYALVFGIISGLSLPLGSWLGVMFSPVSEKTCGMMMAFGAGALLFAVTVELYGHALKEVHAGDIGLLEMFTTIGGALCGAALYLIINRWLEQNLKHSDESPDETDSSGQDEEVPCQDERTPLVSSSKYSTKSLPAGRLERRPSASPRVNGMIAGSISTSSLLKKNHLKRIRGREKAMRALTHQQAQYSEGRERKKSGEEVQHAKSVAFSLFLGLLIDGVPEGILIGFLSAEGHLTPVLIISLFIANFPEAFSSASLLIQANMSTGKIIGMWTSLCVLVGCLGGASCWLLLWCFPGFGEGGVLNHGLPMSVLLGIALIEGITGGAMIACISAVMLPEAFERAGKTGAFYSNSGFLCATGFLLSVGLKALLG